MAVPLAAEDRLPEGDETAAIRFPSLSSTIQTGSMFGTDVVFKDNDRQPNVQHTARHHKQYLFMTKPSQIAETKVESVNAAVRQVAETAREFPRLVYRDESTMRCALVDPILWALGWKTWLPLQCQPDFRLGQRGNVDYALVRPGRPTRSRTSSSRNRQRVGRLTASGCKGSYGALNHGVAVLTYGTYWEVYDLSRRTRRFSDKLVERLMLDLDREEEIPDVADALCCWIGRDQWW